MSERSTVTIPYLSEEANVVTYDNGYTFVFVPKRGDVFNISTWVRTGSIHEDDENNGISHFLEHLMFKGTKRFKPGEFDKMMEGMGAIINAATWKDFTFYYITGPKGNGNFETALDMHADMMLHSTIPAEEVGPPYDPFDPDYAGEKRERSVVIEEIGMREDMPWTKIYNALNHMMYCAGHPYRRDVIGTREIIGHIPRETIYDYYRRWYSPQNLITIVSGDFKLDTLEQQIRRHFDFSHLPPSNAQAVDEGPAFKEPDERMKILKEDYQTSFFIMGFHGPDPNDLKESIALDVVSHVMGEGRSSRLTQELLEKPAHPVFNFVACGQSTIKLGNAFYIQGNFHSPDTEGAIDQVSEQLRRLLDDRPVTAEEMERAKKRLKVNFAETSETVSGIAEAIGESLTVVGDLSHYTRYLDELSRLDLDTVNAVAQKYLQPAHAFTAAMVPKANPQDKQS